MAYTVTNNPWTSQYNLGVGTETASEVLHLNASSGNGPEIRFQNASTSNYIRGYTNINIHTGGAEAYTFGSNGNMGIGETSPSTRLHIKGAEPAITLQNSDTAGDDTTKLNYVDVNDQIHAQLRTVLKDDSDGGAYDSAFDIRTAVNGTLETRIAIKEDGKVGIGATIPSNPLYVKHATSGSAVIHSNADTAGTMSTLYFKSVNTSEANNGQRQKGAIIFEGDGSGVGPGQLYFCVDTTTDSGNAGVADSKMTISGSNVGIGTTTPTGIMGDTNDPTPLLHIKGGRPGFVLEDTDDNLDFEVEVTFHRNGKFIGHGSDYIEVPRGRTRPFEVTEYNCPMTNFEVDLFVR